MSSPIGTTEKLHSELPLRGRDSILSTLGRLALPKEEYFLVGGANLVLRGVKLFTRDIDALVSDDLFQELLTQQDVRIKQPPVSARSLGATNTTAWIEREGLSIPFTATTSMGDGYYPLAFETHKSQVELVEGFPCVPLEVVRASKLALQRPSPASDLDDLRSIADFTGIPLESPLPAPTVSMPHSIS